MDAIRKITALVFAIVLATPAPVTGTRDPAPLALRRCTLGEVFESSGKENRDRFLKDCALDLKQVVSAFDECKLTVTEKPLPRTGGEMKKTTDLQLHVEGKRAFVLRDKNGKSVSLDVAKLDVVISSTWAYKSASAPTRYQYIIAYEFNGKHSVKLAGLVGAEHTFRWCFTSPHYAQDATGKSFDPKKDLP